MDGKTESSPLKQKVFVLLDKEEQNLHRRLLTSRHQVHAHSDARKHLIPRVNYASRSFHLKLDPFFFKLGDHEIRMLRAMSGKWIKYLQKERSELKAARS